MSSKFFTMTIKEAIDKIVARTFLIPAIQRKFVWNSDQIEVLFDSIMRGYPINSFMFWEVKDNEIKNGFKFYELLKDYREFFRDTNPDVDTKGNSDFEAIIDGQQRLTSLYIGLKGSYGDRLARKWLKDCEENIPTKHLYLNLSEPLPDENERLMVYHFQFLTDREFNNRNGNGNAIWYRINHILTFNDRNELDAYIDKMGWLNRDFTKNSIRRLYDVIFKEDLINYYLEKTQQIDTVLDIFIRANSGGKPLSFSDLLMSITIVNWKSDGTDAKEQMDEIRRKVFELGKPGFVIDQDFILKTCLVLFNDNLKFQIKNFDKKTVSVFEQNWDRIKKSIIESFTLISNLGFNNQNLRAKNAVIPIIYYIFHRGIENTINNPIKNDEDKQLIRKWLCLCLLKGIFGGQSDTVLSGIRRVLKAQLADTSKQPSFPLESIKEAFETNPTKNLSFSDDLIDGLLTRQKDDPDCFAILSLLYFDSGLKFGNQDYHKDHLHPAKNFYKIERADFESEESKFYLDPSNWNGIANLQLLNGPLNQSKGAKSLQEWVTEEQIDKKDLLIPDVSLDIADFKNFIEKRKELLKSKLKELVGA